MVEGMGMGVWIWGGDRTYAVLRCAVLCCHARLTSLFTVPISQPTNQPTNEPLAITTTTHVHKLTHTHT